MQNEDYLNTKEKGWRIVKKIATGSNYSMTPARYSWYFISQIKKYEDKGVKIFLKKENTSEYVNAYSILAVLSMCIFDKEKVEISVKGNNPRLELEKIAQELKTAIERFE